MTSIQLLTRSLWTCSLAPLLVTVCFLSGCSSALYKQHWPERGPVVKRHEINCDRPFDLSVGCNKRHLATIGANLHGLEFDVASSSEGSIVLIQAKMVSGGTSVITNMIHEAVRTEMERNGIGIKSIIAIEDHYLEGADIIVGYLLTLDGQGFNILTPYESGRP